MSSHSPCLWKRNIRKLDKVVSNVSQSSQNLGKRCDNQLLWMSVVSSCLFEHESHPISGYVVEITLTRSSESVHMKVAEVC